MFQEQPADPWTKFDFLLLEAYQMLQDETCGMCGNPVWICRNPYADNVGFKIKSTKCFAKAELEKHQERAEKSQNKKPKYGEHDIVVPYTYDGGDLPTRMSYYLALAKEHSPDEE